MKEHFPHQVFREYDIRGFADKEITTDFAYALAQAYVRLLPNHMKAVVVGRDVRLSGEKLQRAVMQGLVDQGIDVLDIGMVPTPLAYYGVFQHEAAGCIMITASHNPAAYNGFKLMLGKDSFHGKGLQQLKNIMLAGGFSTAKQCGKIHQRNLNKEYQQFVAEDCVLQRPLQVVIDAGNGPSGLIAAPLYRALGCEVFELYCTPDGRFPNHHPDPTVEENLTDLKKEVLRVGADLGIAFDGDGDRVGVVNEQGKVVWGDMLLLLLSRQLLKKSPGATIISEVKSSQLLYDDIDAHGGKAVMWRTGHSPIKSKMKETGAKLAGEMSGHFFFADRYFGFDDAVYAGARLMQLIAEQKQPLSTLLADVPVQVSTPEIRIDCTDEEKFKVVAAAKRHFSKGDCQIIEIDGMRLVCEGGWALLRASNTQPALVLRYEAKDATRLSELRLMLEGWLNQYSGWKHG